MIFVVGIAMATGISHDRLRGPDEPREAEIARETLVDGYWVTPRFCGLPFLEKPPLHCNLTALAFWITGRITPGVARTVSLLYGCLMLAAVWFFGKTWRGSRAAWLMVLVLATMPRFWRYSHWILLDIGVGALAASALTSFARAEIFPEGKRKTSVLLSLFAFFTAAAFLTKGIAGFVAIPLVIGAFCLLERRWRPIADVLTPFPLLIFCIPVALWLVLFYREGGVPYVHEHFVNNYLGRFLNIQYQLPDVQFYHTDVGSPWPWYFYFQRLPDILGVWILVLPFAAGAGLRSWWRREEQSERPVFRFLLLWSFLPLLLFSFASQKEVTYIIPSYAGMAILTGAWLDWAILERSPDPSRGRWWLGVVIPLAVLTFFSAGIGQVAFLAISAAVIAALLALLIVSARRGRRGESFYLALAVLLSLTMISHSPVVYPLLHRPRDNDCFDLAPAVWRVAGPDALYLYRPNDDIRGTIPFYGKRTTPEINRREDLGEVLSRPEKVYVVMSPWIYEAALRDRAMEKHLRLLPTLTITEPGIPASLVLISNQP